MSDFHVEDLAGPAPRALPRLTVTGVLPQSKEDMRAGRLSVSAVGASGKPWNLRGFREPQNMQLVSEVREVLRVMPLDFAF